MANHPDVETLLRYHDGALTGRERKALQAHLRGCAVCRLEEHRLRLSGLQKASQGLTSNPPPVSNLLGRVQQWEEARRRDGFTGEALKLRVASELAPYVGAEGARGILRDVSSSGENLLSTVESALRLFIGSAAASALVSRIVDRAIVRP